MCRQNSKYDSGIWLIFLQYSNVALLITRECATKASADHLIEICAKHAGDADITRTIARRILGNLADLPAQLWSTFDIVDQRIAQTREYMDLLSSSENRSNSACSLLLTLRSGCPSSFADTRECDCEAAHIGGVPDVADLTPFCSRRHGARHSGPPVSSAKAIRGAERQSAHNPLFENGFRVTGSARSKSNNRLQRAFATRPPRSALMRSDGRNWINSRTIEIPIGGISPLQLTGSTAVRVSESHEAIYACAAASTGLFV